MIWQMNPTPSVVTSSSAPESEPDPLTRVSSLRGGETLRKGARVTIHALESEPDPVLGERFISRVMKSEPDPLTALLRLETSAMATRSRLKVREGKNMAGAQWAGRNRGGLLRRAPHSVLEHEIEMHGEADGTNTPAGHEAEQECL